MDGRVRQRAFGGIGVLFLALAVFEFFMGDPWIVWVLIGILFGGLGIFRKTEGQE